VKRDLGEVATGPSQDSERKASASGNFYCSGRCQKNGAAAFPTLPLETTSWSRAFGQSPSHEMAGSLCYWPQQAAEPTTQGPPGTCVPWLACHVVSSRLMCQSRVDERAQNSRTLEEKRGISCCGDYFDFDFVRTGVCGGVPLVRCAGRMECQLLPGGGAGRGNTYLLIDRDSKKNKRDANF